MDDNSSQQEILPHEVPSKQRFSRGIIFALLASLILIVIVGVYILINSKASRSSNQTEKNLIPTPHTFVSPIVNKEVRYEIRDGSVFKILSNGKQELFVAPAELKYEQLEVSEINSFELSSDKSKMLLFSSAGITPYLLFYKNTANNDIVSVGFGEEAKWSPNGRYIAFTHRPADVGPLRLYVFDTTSNEEKETIQSKDKVRTSYTNLRWSADSSLIIAQYEIRDDIPYGNVIDKGETQITIKQD